MVLIRNKHTKTLPYIIHCPLDNPGSLWLQAVDIILNQTESLEKPDDVTIITFNNTVHKMLLEKCLDATKTDYVVLGKDVRQWTNPTKINLLIDFLPQVRTKFILCLDALDVVIARSLRHLVDEFRRFKCSILFNASSFAYPNESHYSALEEKMCDDYFNHLNSGCFIGYTDYCLEIYRRCLAFNDRITAEHHYSDQIKLKAMYVKEYPKIQLDSKNEIFQIFNVRDHYVTDFLEITGKYFL